MSIKKLERDEKSLCEIESGVKLVDVSKNDGKWDKKKTASTIISDYYKSDNELKRRSERIKTCAQWLGFSKNIDETTGEFNIKLQQTWFCRVRHCPVCEWRRSMKWRAKFYQKLPELLQQYPNYRFLFLTLTVQNCDVAELRETIQWMNKAWSKLVKRKQFNIVKGWLRTTEVTKAKNNKAHPHFHIVLMVPPSYFSHNYIKAEEWQKLWQSCLKADYLPITNIKPVKDIKKGILEVLKYSVKSKDLVADRDWFVTFAKQVHRLRFIASGGLLKDILKEDLDKMSNDELIHTDEENTEAGKNVDFYFTYNYNNKCYIKD